MLQILVATIAFRIVSNPTSTFADNAFSVFKYCKNVKEVYLLCKEEQNALFSVGATHVLDDDARIHVCGRATQKQRAYHAASASALYALNKHNTMD